MWAIPHVKFIVLSYKGFLFLLRKSGPHFFGTRVNGYGMSLLRAFVCFVALQKVFPYAFTLPCGPNTKTTPLWPARLHPHHLRGLLSRQERRQHREEKRKIACMEVVQVTISIYEAIVERFKTRDNTVPSRLLLDLATEEPQQHFH